MFLSPQTATGVATRSARAAAATAAAAARPNVHPRQKLLPTRAGPSSSSYPRSSYSFSSLSSPRATASRPSHPHTASGTPRTTGPSTPVAIRRRLATAATPEDISARYTALTPDDVTAVAKLLSNPTASLLTTLAPSDPSCGVKPCDPTDLQQYNVDWMNKYHGRSRLVVKPRATDEASAVVKYCYQRGLAIVPQGGNTGLVGGGVPVADEVVISLASMNKIRSFDAVSGTLVADAGCILEVLDNHIGAHGYMMPLDLGAKGSCHIGGNVATNAGGLRFLRYGSLHGSVLGLEVVLPDGRVLDSLSTLRKDNTGLDLKQLFIGSEGSIGLITGVSIVTPRRPSAFNVAVFAVPSFQHVEAVFPKVKAHCGEILSAFEFFDRDAMRLVKGHATAGVRDPFSEEHPFYVLIETGGSNKEHDDQKLGELLEELLETSSISDGVLAQDETQLKSLWALRESIPEAAGKAGKVFKYDLSMPVPKMNELVEQLRARFEAKGELGEGKSIRTVVGYGHIGDGNLHVNIVAKSYSPEIEAMIEPYIYEWTSGVKGSISAEHGLGRMKGEKIGYSKSDESVALMQDIKRLLDPKGLFNPGKYLPGA